MIKFLVSLLLLGVVLGSGCVNPDCSKAEYFKDVKFDAHEFVSFSNQHKFMWVNITHPGHRDFFHPDKKVFQYTLIHCGCTIPDKYIFDIIIINLGISMVLLFTFQ